MSTPIVHILRPPGLVGELVVPGDKSISHRAVMLNAIAAGVATVTNAGLGADNLSTVACMRALGVRVRERQEASGERQDSGVWAFTRSRVQAPHGALAPEAPASPRLPGSALPVSPAPSPQPPAPDAATLVIEGCGPDGLSEPVDALDAGNSGTTARLLSGILAGQPFFSVLTGDASLRSRPMGRVIEPLTLMGARIWARRSGTFLPMAVAPSRLRGIEYRLPVASAQLKSCLLLAALFADGATVLDQPAASRDHTERMLAAQGVRVVEDGLRLTIEGGRQPRAVDVEVPGDLSSAAFWLVAGLIHPAARVTVRNVGVNPTRTGLLDALESMGATIRREHERLAGGEPVADLTVESCSLRGASLGGDLIPRLIDEVPIVAVAAAVAEGTTEIRDAAELRVKESDRLAAMARELSRIGARVEELPDGLVIHGGHRPAGGECDSHGDHRIAMAMAVAGLVAAGPVAIHDAGCVEISYPTFWGDLDRLAPGAVSEG